MEEKKQSNQSSNTVIAFDLGDKKHAAPVLGNRREAAQEFVIPNRQDSLLELAGGYPEPA